MKFRGEDVMIQEACDTAFEGVDIVLGAAENDIAKKFAPAIVKAGAVFVDNSSAFRLDPTVPLFLMQKEGMTAAEIEDVLNRKSGLLGVSGVSNDARYVWDAADAGNERAQLAMDLLVHNAKKIIGSYVAEMNGVDILIFTAGLGENDRRTRQLIGDNMEFLGIKMDKDANMNGPRGENIVISAPDSKVKVVVIPTDEEYMIASDTYDLVK
jgi:acetate kinase